MSRTAKRPEKLRGGERKCQAHEQPLEMWVLEKPRERLLAQRGWMLQGTHGAPAAGKQLYAPCLYARLHERKA